MCRSSKSNEECDDNNAQDPCRADIKQQHEMGVKQYKYNFIVVLLVVVFYFIFDIFDDDVNESCA